MHDFCYSAVKFEVILIKRDRFDWWYLAELLDY